MQGVRESFPVLPGSMRIRDAVREATGPSCALGIRL